MPTIAGTTYGVSAPGFRIPDATRVGGVELQVSDLQRSLDYYRDVIGLCVLEASGVSARLGPHDDTTTLVTLHERRGTRPIPRSGRLGLFHFAVLLPARDALGRFLAHLSARGVELASADHFVSEAVYLWDPDGLGIEVYADRARDAWRTSGRELYMTTERLDRRSLQAAAGSEPWRGIPPGTRMGHVHLSVNDLAPARELYHVALGLDMVVWSYPGALFLSAGGYHHHLGVNTWAAGARPATEDEARLLEWELRVPAAADVDAAAASLRGAGYDVIDGTATRAVVDPWGIRLALRAAEATG